MYNDNVVASKGLGEVKLNYRVLKVSQGFLDVNDVKIILPCSARCKFSPRTWALSRPWRYGGIKMSVGFSFATVSDFGDQIIHAVWSYDQIGLD